MYGGRRICVRGIRIVIPLVLGEIEKPGANATRSSVRATVTLITSYVFCDRAPFGPEASPSNENAVAEAREKRGLLQNSAALFVPSPTQTDRVFCWTYDLLVDEPRSITARHDAVRSKWPQSEDLS